MDLPEKSRAGDNGVWTPNCEFLVSTAGMAVLVELAGTRSDEININYEGSRLSITGERSRPSSTNGDVAYSGEVQFGRYQVVLEFPARFDLSRARAAYLNGFLRIDVPESDGTQNPALQRYSLS